MKHQEVSVPESACPVCYRVHDRATGLLEDATPSPGDLSICVRCGAILEYNEDLHLGCVDQKKLQQLEQESAKTYKALMKAQFLVRFKSREK